MLTDKDVVSVDVSPLTEREVTAPTETSLPMPSVPEGISASDILRKEGGTAGQTKHNPNNSGILILIALGLMIVFL